MNQNATKCKELVTAYPKVTACDDLPVFNRRQYQLTRQPAKTRHYPSPVTNEPQSTLEPISTLPELSSVEREPLWSLKTPVNGSAESTLEPVLLSHSGTVEPRPHPATAVDIARAESIMERANEKALRRAYERGHTSNGTPLSIDAGAVYREAQSTLSLPIVAPII